MKTDSYLSCLDSTDDDLELLYAVPIHVTNGNGYRVEFLGLQVQEPTLERVLVCARHRLADEFRSVTGEPNAADPYNVRRFIRWRWEAPLKVRGVTEGFCGACRKI